VVPVLTDITVSLTGSQVGLYCCKSDNKHKAQKLQLKVRWCR